MSQSLLAEGEAPVVPNRAKGRQAWVEDFGTSVSGAPAIGSTALE